MCMQGNEDQWLLSGFHYENNNKSVHVRIMSHTSTIGNIGMFTTSEMIYHRGGEPERAMHC